MDSLSTPLRAHPPPNRSPTVDSRFLTLPGRPGPEQPEPLLGTGLVRSEASFLLRVRSRLPGFDPRPAADPLLGFLRPSQPRPSEAFSARASDPTDPPNCSLRTSPLEALARHGADVLPRPEGRDLPFASRPPRTSRERRVAPSLPWAPGEAFPYEMRGSTSSAAPSSLPGWAGPRCRSLDCGLSYFLGLCSPRRDHSPRGSITAGSPDLRSLEVREQLRFSPHDPKTLVEDRWLLWGFCLLVPLSTLDARRPKPSRHLARPPTTLAHGFAGSAACRLRPATDSLRVVCCV